MKDKLDQNNAHELLNPHFSQEIYCNAKFTNGYCSWCRAFTRRRM